MTLVVSSCFLFGLGVSNRADKKNMGLLRQKKGGGVTLVEAKQKR